MKLDKTKYIRIAIDSTAGSGSTSIAKLLAKHYKLRYLDTGKVYRWCAYQILKKKPQNQTKFLRQKIKKLKLNELKSKKLIDDDVAQLTSRISKQLSLRKLVLGFQKNIAYKIPPGFKGSVLNGRDITYNIIPDATFKFYITANLRERSKRRFKELRRLGKKVNLKNVVISLKNRDQSDKKRSGKQGRLKKTQDSQLINTTHLSIKGGFLKVKKIIDREL
tara:strand:+ start:250 stop:909 length:660 start_codon:yes stop_codon:yes gene_type:complete